MTLALKEHYLPVVNVIGLGLGLGKERVSRYDVGAEGTLPPSSKCDRVRVRERTGFSL